MYEEDNALFRGISKMLANNNNTNNSNPIQWYQPANKIDHMQLINPIYTREQAPAVDPLQMYRDYKQTGNIPQMASSYQPYTPPEQTQQSPVQQPFVSATGKPRIRQEGGK